MSTNDTLCSKMGFSCTILLDIYEKKCYTINSIKKLILGKYKEIMRKTTYTDILQEKEQSERCLTLLKMIIAQGLIDANAKTKNKIRKKGKKVIKKFFKEDNRWFSRICELIDTDKHHILKIYKKINRWKKRKSCLSDTMNSKEMLKILNNRTKK